MTRFNALLISLLVSTLISAQCINTFPYVEDFETSNGTWTTGGTNVDWKWGTPSKATITGAGSGVKCWISGGLTGSFYKYSEASYVKSPCFDFTNVKHPFIQFLIFWESENKYDGTNLQYSLNGGTTWVNVGAFGDAVNCLNNNWYNLDTIKYLQGLATPQSGWCGNAQASHSNCQGGGGSKKWVTANHCLSGLAGQSNVTFRFTFGAGTTCNDYDGVAFDSVAIGEAPANGGTFSYTCTNNNTVTFAGTPTMCPDTTLWNFNDAGSGASNTSSILGPSHTFSAPGTYNVALTLAGPCNAPITINKSVTILNVSATPTNAGCASTTGSIQVNVTGGSGTYSYAWNAGLTGQNPSGVNPGTYTVTVTSAQTCPATASATISNTGGSVTAHSTTTNNTCGATNGSITLSVTGGSAPYSYSWTGGLSGQNPTGVSSGTYDVTITDNAGCSATASAVVAGTSSPHITVTSVNTSCGNNNGSASVNVTSGTGPYTYAWSNSSNNFSVANLAAGSYTVTVSGAGGCTATASTSVSSSTGLSVATSTTSAGCTSNGTATATPSGGGGAYTYFWSTGATSQTATSLSSGNYTVTVNGSGCSATGSASVGTTGGGIGYTPTTSAASCGTANGGAGVTVTAGNGPFTYAWSNSTTASSISNVASGTYTVTIDGSGGCSAVASLTIPSVGGLNLSTTPTATTCGANNGSATVSVTAGPGPYTYSWSGGGSSATESNLASGSYTVTTTGSGGCSGTASVSIAPSTGVTLNLTSTNTSCGTPNGTATVLVTIGTGPYNYYWSNGGVASSLSNLQSGTYTITVHDNTGCTASDSTTINPSTGPSVTAVANKTIMCSGDSATLCAQPSGFASYSWNIGDNTSCLTTTYAGNYTVTVVDNNQCSAVSNQISLSNYTPSPVTVSVNGDTLTSYYGTSYQWYFNNQPIPGDTTRTIVAQQTGAYSVQLTDAHGCKYNSTSTTVNTLGINDVAAVQHIKVYPNPLSGDNWQVQVSEEWIGAKIELFDVNGQIVYRSEITNTNSQIPLHVSNGVYILRIESDTQSACLKLIKL